MTARGTKRDLENSQLTHPVSLMFTNCFFMILSLLLNMFRILIERKSVQFLLACVLDFIGTVIIYIQRNIKTKYFRSKYKVNVVVIFNMHISEINQGTFIFNN